MWRGALLEHSFNSLPLPSRKSISRLPPLLILTLLLCTQYLPHTMSLTSEGITSKFLISFQISSESCNSFTTYIYLPTYQFWGQYQHLLSPLQLLFNSLKYTILKTSQNMMYGLNLWYTEKYCNFGESKHTLAAPLQFTKGIVRTHLQCYICSSHAVTGFLGIRKSFSQEINAIEKLF